ncbi:hypothetical protein DFH06DRAFT_1132190 [Mycena polygramma]|nr:hypothetical protein DFH06DRAFT_1132190 [Mycena polygramma]
MVFCAQCGTPGEGRFCAECGARLGGASTSTSTSTSHIEPPAYDVYAGEQQQPALGVRAGQMGATAFSSGTTASTTGSGGTGGGSTQAAPLRSNVRGVSGTAFAPTPIAAGTTAGGTVSTVHTGYIAQPAANVPYQQQESPTALFGSQGYRLDAFFHIAREIFVALDRTTQPVGTSMMEASKVRRFRELGGKSIPPYYETHVLPMYSGIDDKSSATDQTIGAQCVGSNVLSWEGWNTFLAHKILSSPDEMFAQLGAVLRGLGLQLPWPLVRTDFPAYAYPDAAARELQFQQGIRNLAGAAIGGGQAQPRYGGHGAARRSLMSGLIGNSFLFN